MCGKPLIGWTIEKALLSKYLDLVMVTTDSKDIADISLKHGAYVPFLRPNELATDKSATYDAVEHAIEFLKQERGFFDYTVLLEPTSPLREDDDIDRILEKLDENELDFDSIISVGEVSEHPSIMRRLEGLNIVPFSSNLTQTTRRQDNEPAYFPYGVAYVAKTQSLLEEKTFYTKRSTYFKLLRYQAYEIDDLCDFWCTQAIMREKWGLT